MTGTPNYLLAALLLPPASLGALALLGLVLLRWRRTLGVLLILASAVALLALSLPVTAGALARGLEVAPLAPDHLRRAQAIVILAGGASRAAPEWGGEAMNPFTAQRVHYGAALARRTQLPLLVTGGTTQAGLTAEAELMRRALVDVYGLPVRWVEADSRTTAENASRSAPLLRAAGVQRVLLVTDAVHMRRARRVFELQGFEVLPAPTGYWGQGRAPAEVSDFVPTAEALRRSSHVLREWLANALYLVSG